MAHDWKVNQYVIEVLLESDGFARVSDLKIEYVEDQEDRLARITQCFIEYIQDQEDRFARVSQIFIEVIEEIETSTSGYVDEASAGDFAW